MHAAHSRSSLGLVFWMSVPPSFTLTLSQHASLPLCSLFGQQICMAGGGSAGCGDLKCPGLYFGRLHDHAQAAVMSLPVDACLRRTFCAFCVACLSRIWFVVGRTPLVPLCRLWRFVLLRLYASHLSCRSVGCRCMLQQSALCSSHHACLMCIMHTILIPQALTVFLMPQALTVSTSVCHMCLLMTL
jgi:hypothetical protein